MGDENPAEAYEQSLNDAPENEGANPNEIDFPDVMAGLEPPPGATPAEIEADEDPDGSAESAD